MNTAWTVVERMRLDERLRAERDLLRATLLSIGDGILATGPDGRVILINDVARALTGWAGDEAVGQPLDAVLNLIDEHTREPFALSVTDPLLPLTRLPDNLLLLSRDGSTRPVSDSIAPIP